jgi:hypothetical protein
MVNTNLSLHLRFNSIFWRRLDRMNLQILIMKVPGFVIIKVGLVSKSKGKLYSFFEKLKKIIKIIY